MTDTIPPIPQYLKRTNEDTMSDTQEQAATEQEPVAQEQQEPSSNDEANAAAEAMAKELADANQETMTPEQCFERLKTLTAKRDQINEAISAHKKIMQRMIGRL